MKKLILVILSLVLLSVSYAQKAPDPNGGMYFIRAHDNLYRIALKYHVTVTQLMKWNNLPNTTITEGQYLRVPIIAIQAKGPSMLNEGTDDNQQLSSAITKVVVDTIIRVDTIQAVIDEDSLRAQVIGILEEREQKSIARNAAKEAAAAAAKDSLGKIVYSGYVSGYYAYYSDSVGTANYQKHPGTDPKSNQFGLNIAMFSAAYTNKKVRGVATFQYGDFVTAVWPVKFRYLQEANIGVRLADNLWLDAGFFKKYFGIESFLIKDNLTSNLSIGTTFEPLSQAGLRLGYKPSDKISISIYVMNGYNRFDDNNEKKSGGLLTTFRLNDKLTLGYSGYYGDDGVTGKHFRTANNLFANLTLSKFRLTAGGDFFTQQNSVITDPEKTAFAYSALLVASFNFTPKYRLYTKGEMFNDKDAMLSTPITGITGNVAGLKIYGATLGFEFKPASNAYLRLEGRTLVADSDQQIYLINSVPTNIRYEGMLNIGAWF